MSRGRFATVREWEHHKSWLFSLGFFPSETDTNLVGYFHLRRPRARKKEKREKARRKFSSMETLVARAFSPDWLPLGTCGWLFSCPLVLAMSFDGRSILQTKWKRFGVSDQNIKENVWKKCLKVKWKCLFWKCFQLLETLFVSCVSHVLFKLKEMHLTLVFYRQTGRRFHRKIPCSKKHTSHGSPTWPCDITVWPAMRAIRHRCFCRCCTRFAFLLQYSMKI